MFFIISIRLLILATRLVLPSTALNASMGAIRTTIWFPKPLKAVFTSKIPAAARMIQQVMVVTPKGTLCQMNIIIINSVTASTIYISIYNSS